MESDADVSNLHAILKAAADGGASDVHLKEDAPVVVRINRKLIAIECPSPTRTWFESVLGHIIPPHLKKTLADDREADFSYFHPGCGRFRTNAYQQSGRWAMSMRYVKSNAPDIDQLGLAQICKTLAESPRGIVLLAGTTGCGKSTTLAAMVEHVNSNFKKHIVTIEDPIEYMFEDNQSIIEQRELGLDTASFARGLMSALRQDPDIIMVGEMRDAISIHSSMSAADTGHLVLSTLHTTNAASSIGRILDFFKQDDRDAVRRQMAGTLRAVICQRMVPTIEGGMTPAQEILINSPTVRKMIEENRLEKLPAAIETGREDGMQSFNQAVYDLVKAGRVTKEDAMEKASNPQALEMMFQGIFLSSGSRILG
jgi:twitching motility protein PilT